MFYFKMAGIVIFIGKTGFKDVIENYEVDYLNAKIQFKFSSANATLKVNCINRKFII